MNNSTNSKLTDAQPCQLIDRYFEAETPLEEEALLRRMVAHRTEPQFNAIRAVLGYASAKRRASASAERRRRSRLRVAAAAAVVAVVASVGIGIAHSHSVDGACYAMVGGTRINDEAQVVALMQGSLGDIGDAAAEASVGIESQFSDFAPFITE